MNDLTSLTSISERIRAQFVAKNSASQPAPKDVIEEVAAKYRGALLAIAD